MPNSKRQHQSINRTWNHKLYISVWHTSVLRWLTLRYADESHVLRATIVVCNLIYPSMTMEKMEKIQWEKWESRTSVQTAAVMRGASAFDLLGLGDESKGRRIPAIGRAVWQSRAAPVAVALAVEPPRLSCSCLLPARADDADEAVTVEETRNRPEPTRIRRWGRREPPPPPPLGLGDGGVCVWGE
jgi:hypothetical protein